MSTAAIVAPAVLVAALQLQAIAQTTKSVSQGAYSQAQADRGQRAYAEHCATCHQSDLRGGGYAPSLVDDAFTTRWQRKTVWDLTVVTAKLMPKDSPGTLSDQTNADIVAYLLAMNRYAPGAEELPVDEALLKQIGFGTATVP